MSSSTPTRTAKSGAMQRLMSELAALQKEKWVHFETEPTNLFKWRFALMVVNPDSDFNGGYFKAEMTFADDYPYAPPKFRFLVPGLFHPNIYNDGQLCISILHKPGEDITSGEAASERWSPLQGVESVMRSVLLLLDDPEINSPANVDASILYRDQRAKYNERARTVVQRSQKEIPQGFTMPKSFEPTPPVKPENDDDFFLASEDELDLGGSDTNSDDELMDFEDEGEDDDDDDQEEDEEERDHDDD